MAERLPGLPLARLGVAVAIDEPAGRGDEQTEGHVGRGVGQHAGRVADGDAARRGGRHVDVVEADGVIAHHLEPGRRVEQGGVDAVGQQRHQTVAVGDLLLEHVVGRRQRLGPDLGVALLANAVQARGGNRRVTNTFGLPAMSSSQVSGVDQVKPLQLFPGGAP